MTKSEINKMVVRQLVRPIPNKSAVGASVPTKQLRGYTYAIARVTAEILTR